MSARNLAISKRGLTLGVALFLAGCASVTPQQSIQAVNAATGKFVGESVALRATDPARADAREKVKSMLAAPLGQADAVKVMLLNSAAFQALLAQGVADSAAAAQLGRIQNPSLSIERMTSAADIELTRVLSFGLLDILTLPQRNKIAEQAIDASHLQLASTVVQAVANVKRAWVEAVAAEAAYHYAGQVMRSANASAELAARMQRVGNLTVLARSSQQMYAADAAVNLAAAQHQRHKTREGLIRLLGLRYDQQALLTLPKRLVMPPEAPRPVEEVNAQLVSARLDVRISAHQLTVAAKAQGLGDVTSFTDIEWGIRRTSTTERGDGAVATSSGNEISIKLPLFDWGDLQRSRMAAQTLGAINAYEAAALMASSEVREAYSAYRTAFDIAQHYQQEIIPLRQRMSEENQYRYNGMMIGTLELLADARMQVGVVQSALKATEQFWLAEAALGESLISSPTAGFMLSGATASAASAGGH